MSCGDYGLRSGDKIVYKGQVYYMRANGSNLYLHDSPEDVKNKIPSRHSPTKTASPRDVTKVDAGSASPSQPSRFNTPVTVAPAISKAATPPRTTVAAVAAVAASPTNASCSDFGLKTGDKISYQGRHYYMKANGTNLYLYDTLSDVGTDRYSRSSPTKTASPKHVEKVTEVIKTAPDHALLYPRYEGKSSKMPSEPVSKKAVIYQKHDEDEDEDDGHGHYSGNEDEDDDEDDDDDEESCEDDGDDDEDEDAQTESEDDKEEEEHEDEDINTQPIPTSKKNSNEKSPAELKIDQIGRKKKLHEYTIEDITQLWAIALPKANLDVVAENGLNGEVISLFQLEDFLELGLNKFQITALSSVINKVPK